MSPVLGGPPSRFLSFDGEPAAIEPTSTSSASAAATSAAAKSAVGAMTAAHFMSPTGGGPTGGGPSDDPSANGLPPIPENTHPGLTPLGPFSNERRAREAALVLASMSIEHALHHASSLSGDAYRTGGFYLLVHDRDAKRAAKSLASYEEENRDWPPKRTRETPRYGGFPFIVLAFAALVVFAWVTGPAKSESRFFLEGTSVTSLVLRSEPFRAVTALTLHADGAHVMGNLLSGALFGRAVERRVGPGLAALGIVAAGSLGNFANAAYYGWIRHAEHASIGASTAVLGSIGILAATQLFLKTGEHRRRWYDLVAPIAGGLALLGSIGSGPESDLGAHGFGFACGLVVGGLLALVLYRKRAVGIIGQLGAAAVAAGIVGGSWALALAR